MSKGYILCDCFVTHNLSIFGINWGFVCYTDMDGIQKIHKKRHKHYSWYLTLHYYIYILFFKYNFLRVRQFFQKWIWHTSSLWNWMHQLVNLCREASLSLLCCFVYLGNVLYEIRNFDFWQELYDSVWLFSVYTIKFISHMWRHEIKMLCYFCIPLVSYNIYYVFSFIGNLPRFTHYLILRKTDT